MAKKHGFSTVIACYLLYASQANYNKQVADYNALRKELTEVNKYMQTTLVDKLSDNTIVMKQAIKVMEGK